MLMMLVWLPQVSSNLQTGTKYDNSTSFSEKFKHNLMFD